ncbi:MAG: hypothetical protein WBC91_26925 [Phototrophicaceae bacterium]
MQNTLNTLDGIIARLLFVTPAQTVYEEKTTSQAENAFSFALMFSGIRCVLMYAILPFVLPLVGVAGDFSLWIDLGINAIAIGAIIYSLRRFWKINYKRKWQYLPIALIALVLLLAFVILDIVTLL